MRLRFGDVILSLASVTIIVVALAAFDDRVRLHAARLLSPDDAGAAAGTVGARLGGLALALAGAMRDQMTQHGPLVLFAVVATVLVVFMLRT
jgi:hypothetical protein